MVPPEHPDPRRNDHPTQTDRVLERQRFANALLYLLPEALSDGESSLITWISRLAVVDQEVGVRYPIQDILALFATQGYHPAAVPTRPTYPKQHPDMLQNPALLAGWLIGQALWDLRECGILHVSVLGWARHYHALLVGLPSLSSPSSQSSPSW